MPAKREYHVKGTNDYLVLSIIFFFLCIWAVKDAWYPSAKVLKKHPQQLDLAFSVPGTVEKVDVTEGQEIGEDHVLASLRKDETAVAFEKAKNAYTAAKKLHTDLTVAIRNGGSTNDQQRLVVAQQEMDQALAKAEDLRNTLEASDLKAPSNGKVLKILVEPHTVVEAGQATMVVDPRDHFYLFNKSLALLSGLLFFVFMAVHFLGQ